MKHASSHAWPGNSSKLLYYYVCVDTHRHVNGELWLFYDIGSHNMHVVHPCLFNSSLLAMIHKNDLRDTSYSCYIYLDAFDVSCEFDTDCSLSDIDYCNVGCNVVTQYIAQILVTF